MPSVIYHSALRDLFTGAIDADTDTFRAMLVTSAYTPNKDTHHKRNDVTGEVTGDGYTAGGAVATVSVSVDAANDRIEITPRRRLLAELDDHRARPRLLQEPRRGGLGRRARRLHRLRRGRGLGERHLRGDGLDAPRAELTGRGGRDVDLEDVLDGQWGCAVLPGTAHTRLYQERTGASAPRPPTPTATRSGRSMT